MSETDNSEIGTVVNRTVLVMDRGEVRVDQMSVDQILGEIAGQRKAIEKIEKHEVSEIPVVAARIKKHEATIEAFKAELSSRMSAPAEAAE